MFIPLMLFVLAFAGCATFARIASRFGGQSYSIVLFWAAVGYLAAGATVWLVAPPEWKLSFPQTLAASVDSATYGHPIEHYAENLLLVMLMACVLGSTLFSAVATFCAMRVRRKLDVSSPGS